MSDHEEVEPLENQGSIERARAMNAERLRHSSQADAALLQYEVITKSDEEDVLSDLLADLMHWADREGQDFDVELLRAKGHYEEESGKRGELDLVFINPTVTIDADLAKWICQLVAELEALTHRPENAETADMRAVRVKRLALATMALREPLKMVPFERD